ncbi:hypothetical protein [Candidatus Burkholderia verschuerenii]|uniref:hypothetical protein n=1 Tax=Candidatus Burkholderia verschuerenii TaxID=242163 RepID=UPI000B332E51|nr:hypothetical protein [Candidatus Burkholderia verschuerenii]
MSQDKNRGASGAPARQQTPASAAPTRDDRRKPVPAPDAQKAEPAPHQRPPVRSDDN